MVQGGAVEVVAQFGWGGVAEQRHPGFTVETWCGVEQDEQVDVRPFAVGDSFNQRRDDISVKNLEGKLDSKTSVKIVDVGEKTTWVVEQTSFHEHRS